MPKAQPTQRELVRHPLRGPTTNTHHRDVHPGVKTTNITNGILKLHSWPISLQAHVSNSLSVGEEVLHGCNGENRASCTEALRAKPKVRLAQKDEKPRGGRDRGRIIIAMCLRRYACEIPSFGRIIAGVLAPEGSMRNFRQQLVLQSYSKKILPRLI